MACQDCNVDDIEVLEDRLRDVNIVSENWIVVDKSEQNKNENSCSLSKEHGEESKRSVSTTVLSHLKPYVPFSVEEVSFTTRLDTWSNRNVRINGLLHLSDENYYLESINEPGGPYKILIVFKNQNSLPLPDQVVQVFGEIEIVREKGNAKPIVNVLFFRNLEINYLPVYTEVIERMRQYIPLFINNESVLESRNNDDDSQYCHYHRLCDDIDDYEHESDLYSNDNTDCI